MIEKDFHVVQQKFRDAVGPVATAEISEEGALRSAGVILDIMHKIDARTTQPSDLMRATIATSQLIERWGQLRQRYVAGSIPRIDDEEIILQAHDMLTVPDVPLEVTQKMLTAVYVASPAVGAIKALEVFTTLRVLYPTIPIRQQGT